MVSSALLSLALLAASALVPGVAATVFPTAPVQGTIYTEGQTCHIAWLGDTTSTTTWAGMSIQLMTGQNLNMVQLEVIASNLDGTQDGSFDHTCPDVSLNAPIYFYRFTSAGSSGNPNYSARFTIAGTDGSTEPAPETDSAGVQWGTGEIVSGDDSSSTTSSTSTKSVISTVKVSTVSTATATRSPSVTPIPSSGSSNQQGNAATVTKTVIATDKPVTTTVWAAAQTVTTWGAAVTVTQTITAPGATITIASPNIPATVTLNVPVTTTVTVTAGTAKMVTVTTSTSTATGVAKVSVPGGKASNNGSSAAISLDLRLISVLGVIAATMTLMF